MAEEVVISSMRDYSEAVEDVKVADVKALFDTHVNAGKGTNIQALASVFR